MIDKTEEKYMNNEGVTTCFDIQWKLIHKYR